MSDLNQDLETLGVGFYRDGYLSLSEAAEFAQQPLGVFLESLAAEGVPALGYDPAELTAELTVFARASAGG